MTPSKTSNMRRRLLVSFCARVHATDGNNKMAEDNVAIVNLRDCDRSHSSGLVSCSGSGPFGQPLGTTQSFETRHALFRGSSHTAKINDLP